MRQEGLVVAVVAGGLWLALVVPAGAAIRNVPADYPSIMAAIIAAADGDEVVVAPGGYDEPIDTLGKAITVRSTNPTNPTVVNTTMIISAVGPLVTIANGEGPNTRILGLTLTGANGVGAGIYVSDASPVLAYNRIYNNTCNSAILGGAGMHIAGANAAPLIEHNRIYRNTAWFGGGIEVAGASPIIRSNDIYQNSGGGQGGGLRLYGGGTPLVENNSIHDNSAGSSAGGGLISTGAATIRGNRIYGNTGVVGGAGGGLYLAGRDTVTNNIIYRNTPLGVFANGPSCTLLNNTITHNDTNLYLDGSWAGRFTVSNCNITYGGTGIGVSGANPVITYCNVFGNTTNYLDNEANAAFADPTGTNGNISREPLYVDIANNDFHERSRNGHWDAGTAQWVQDAVSSPCLDAGDPTTAYNLEPRPHGWRVNIGAYGNTAQASRSSLLIGSSPNDSDNNVRRRAPVVLDFAWPVRQGSAESHFTLAPAGSGGVPLTGTCEWLQPHRKLRFTPDALLLPNGTYQVTLTAGIERMDNRRCYWSETFCFSVGQIPGVTACWPQGSAARLLAPIHVQFDQAMHRQSCQDNLTINPPVTGTFAWRGSTQMLFRPEVPLPPNTTYEVTVGAQSRSGGGVPMGSDYTWSFTTRPLVPAGLLASAVATPSGGAQVTVNLTEAACVQMVVCNLAGRTVAVLPEQALPDGTSTLLWSGCAASGTRVPAGSYLLRLTAHGADGHRCEALATVQVRR